MVNKVKKASELNGIHAGKDIYIIGSGPQLNKITNKEWDFLRTQVTIGVNDVVYKIAPTYLLSAYPYCMTIASFRAPTSQLINMRLNYVDPAIKGSLVVKRVIFDGKLWTKFDDTTPVLATKMNVALGALHLSLILGAKRIITIGIEQNSKLHFTHELDCYRRMFLEDNLKIEAHTWHTKLWVDHPKPDLLDWYRHYLSDPSEKKKQNFSDLYEHAPTFKKYINIINDNNIDVITTTPDSIISRAGGKFVPLYSIINNDYNFLSKKNKAVIVLGMHRSGTSALMRLLNLMGVELGDNLMPASQENEKGYWESAYIVDLNRDILKKFDCTWKSLKFLPDDWSKDLEKLFDLNNMAKQFLIDKFATSKIWGMKDPRLSRLLPFWGQIIENELHLEAHYVISLRNPIEVSRSLAKRQDVVNDEYSYFLWLIYNLEAERYTRGKNRSFVCYDSLLSDWQLVVRKIESECGLQFPNSIDKAKASIDDFIMPTLKHNSVNDIGINYGDIYELSKEVYGLLSKGECLTNDYQRLDEVYEVIKSADIANNIIDNKRNSIGVVVHLYYIDLWPEIKRALKSILHGFDLYISIPIPIADISLVEDEIKQCFSNVKIYKLINKGRDVLPFLTIFKDIESLNYDLVLKLHSKKSPHLTKGNSKKWREITYNSLAGGSKRVNDILDLFELNPTLGIFSPTGALFDFKSTDINYQIVNQLLPGIDQETFDNKNYSYAAGSMFWFRPEALKKILQLDLTEENFEEELGQLDGTLAHAVERLFGVICQTSGYILTDRMPVRDDVVYQNWLDSKRETEQKQSNNFLVTHDKSNLKIHCIIYVDNEDLSLLANTIDSFSAQSYENWHLSVVSCFACPDEMFNEVEQLSWLRVSELSELNVILNTLNVESDWLAIIEAGDCLESHALASCVEFIAHNSDAHVIYTDDDRVSSDNFYHSPQFKPGFNLDLLYSTDYTAGLVLFNAASLNKIVDIVFPNIFLTYDLILNYLDTFSEKVIIHKQSILLHRSESVAAIKILQTDLRKKVLSNHFTRKNIQADILAGYVEGDFKIEYCHEDQPKVSIIIPTKDQLPLLKACVESILDKTEYLDYEIIIIDNQSKEVETLAYFNAIQEKYSGQVRVIEYAKPYNYSAINNFAVQQAVGDYLVLLNNDTMILQGDWLAGMLNHAMREEVGVVGVKLVFPDKTLQHAGVVLGMGANGVAEHPHIGISMELPGYMNRAAVTQSLSAVTAACLMVEKDLYQQIGGLDEDKFKILYNDVDLCLKVRETGKKVIWTPHVTLIHHGSSSLKKVKQDKKKTEQSQQEVNNMLEKWLPQLANDPAYNRNLSLKNTDFQVDTSMNVTWDVDFKGKPRVYAFPANSSGVGEYRVRAPIRGLTQAGMIQSSLANNMDRLIFPTPVEIERIKPDVLWTQNGFLDWMLEPWKKYRKFNDVFMVSGQDDLVYMLPNHHPMKGQWPKNIRRKLKEKFQCSDRVIVANEALAAEFSKLTDDIIVVPNYLEKARWSELAIPEKQIRKKLRVGWAGGQEHIGDLAFILPVVEALHKEVDWVFMGLCPDKLMPFVKEAYQGVEFDLYPQQLANLGLDLAIAPLEHNKFNECKTNLRLLEFGVLAWPIVCSDILPYQNAPVTRVANNVEHWIKVLREKIDDPDELRKEGVLLQRWVMENYMLDDHLDEWFVALMP